MVNSMKKIILMLAVATSVAENVHSETSYGGCSASGYKSNCLQGQGQHVEIHSNDQYYLSKEEYNNYVCNANGVKSICAQGDGQTLTINGHDMTGSRVFNNEHGYFVSQ
jgi:hypothetical protein